MKRTHWLSLLLISSFVSLMSMGCDDDVKKKNNDNNNNINNTNNAVCGNGVLEAGETCDGTALGGEDCTTIEGNFTGGTLACAAGCTAFDTAGCTAGCVDACTLDARVCDGDTLRVCEADLETGCTVWNDTDCTTTSETCQVIEEIAQCAACVDACTIDAERCNAGGTGIETCVLGGAGCTVWSNAPCPQATPECELQGGEPTCVSNCTDACTLDAKRCNTAADGIETCVTGAAGCTEWQNAACGVATPECQDLAGTPTCLAPNGSGESCSDVYVITVPFYTEGTDFAADFTTDMPMTGTGCTFSWTMNGADAVLAVNLTAGEAIIFAQGGGLDGGIYIQSVCDAAGECLDAVDEETTGVEFIDFTAPADGVYYLIVKAYSANPSTRTYAIAVWHHETPAELTCDDGFDNDLDGLVDCEDSDCFGLGACTVETVCGDGLDNDADGDFDCGDVDCAGIEPCGDENTEARCGDGIDNDNDGDTDCEDADCDGLGSCGPENSVAFCADGIDNDNDGMTDCFDTDCNGVGACGPENTEAFCNDGLDNDADGLTDCYDPDCVPIAQCQPGESCASVPPSGLPFRAFGSNFGAYYDNHNFTYSAGGCTTANGPELIFAVDLVAGQQIRMDETNSAFDAVIRVLGACTDVTPTCLVSSDSPETNVRFTAPADGTYYIVLEAYYATTTNAYDFSVFTVTADETGLCADGFDNDVDGLADCNDSDCFGQTGCTAAELNCSDGNDNDGDGDVDCDDADCATFIACLGGDSCVDALPVTLPFNATGTDITADFTNLQTFTGTGCTAGNGVEAVFAVTLTAGQRIKLDETGTLDAVIRVIQPCANATTCLLNQDTTETNLVFTAPADGVYYVILEAWSSSPGASYRGYNFSIALIPDTELTCGDAVDNDLDGRVDCNDPDCFGETGCEVELNCGDGFDNDDDGFADCDDLDCASATACELGEGCALPLVVTTFPYNVTGTNFGADFANDHTFSSATCTVTGGPEAVFEVDLLAGEKLRLNESAVFDAQLRVLPACTTTAPQCLLNSDSETNILFTAPSDGTYYVVLESYNSTSSSAYNFTIEKFAATETSCVDGIDNDLDGATDCADTECAGLGACGPEDTDAICADGIDNDGDGLTDCADTGCASFCTTVFSENFNTWPLVGWTIVDGGTAGFTWVGASTPALTGATGQWAVVNSDSAGSGKTFLEDLISPSINLSGTSSVILNFRHYYRHYGSSSGVVAISTDGGTNWTNVATYSTSTANSAIANLNISSQAAGQANVMIRFRYTSGWDYYWLIDDVAVLAN